MTANATASKVTFQTETATIGIRGTHFGALLCQNDCGGVPTTGGKAPPNGLHVDVTNGSIAMTNSAGTVQLNAGQFGFVASCEVPPQQVPPQQGIQVTMPSSIAQNKGSGKGIGKGDDGRVQDVTGRQACVGAVSPAPTFDNAARRRRCHFCFGNRPIR